jgi:DNA-binding beta-propeller fold protein YncE
MAAVLLGAAPRPLPLTVYSAPAGDRPAGASRQQPIDAVLPDGRSAAPLGVSLFVGTNPFGVVTTPDGRFAIVSNDEQDSSLAPPPPSPELRAGYALTVVDTRTMRVANVFTASGLTLFCGLAALRDPAHPGSTIVLASDGGNNAVRVFTLGNDGSLAQETSIPVPGFPADIETSPDGRIAYVSSNLGNAVSAIDIGSRRILHTANVGFSPFGVGRAGSNLYVANGGLDAYRALSPPAAAPRFATVTGDMAKSSSLSIVPLDASGDVNASAGTGTVRMDQIPDGVDNVGGAHPSALVTRRDGAYAYVSVANVDRVATVALAGEPRVVGGLDLRLFVNAPYGTQPDAEVLSMDGKRLYVALAGLNAVAVLDAREPATLHRLGLIPTGWLPSALALSPDGRYLYITSARGVDGWGLLQRVDLKKLPLKESTLSALRYNRAVGAAKTNAVVPALRSKAKSNVIDRVVYISVGNGTFDSFFGDLGRGNGDAGLAAYNASITPNLHALARTYALADNFYSDTMSTDINTQYALSAMATMYVQKTLPVNAGRTPYDAHGADPEDYPRSGYLFNAMRRQSISYRDYGTMLNVSGYQPTPAETPHARTTATAPPSGLGGTYTLDIPALAALGNNVDLSYSGWNPFVTNASRAAEFVSDMGRLTQADQQPAFTYVWLPATGSASVGDADRALGTIVAFLSHTPHWSSTAVFVVAESPAGTRDHVNRARSYALVVSPLSRSGYVGHHHLSYASVVKTEEELLGLPPTSLGDLLATDMADFFGTVPYPNAYQALP